MHNVYTKVYLLLLVNNHEYRRPRVSPSRDNLLVPVDSRRAREKRGDKLSLCSHTATTGRTSE